MTRSESSEPGRQPATPEERERVQRLFASTLRQEGVHDIAELRDAVCDFVRERRDRGARPEHVIVSLKQIIERVPGVRDVDAKASRHLAESLIRWCIEEYYTPGMPPRAD